MSKNQAVLLPALLISAMFLAACGHRKPAPSEPNASTATKANKAQKPASAEQKPVLTPAPVSASASASAPASAPASTDKIEQVEHDGHAGEVRGTPSADSKFNQLRMGMSMKEVTTLIGKPTDKHSYITGKGFLTSWGSDNYRQEFIYKGLGRLTFSSNGGVSLESHLIRIIHNADEKGTRS